MKLSEHTISVLKNYANINQNLVVKEGDELLTMSSMKNTSPDVPTVKVNVRLVALLSIVRVAYTTAQSLEPLALVPVVVPALSVILAVTLPEPLDLLTQAAKVTSLLRKTLTVPAYV